MAEWIQVEVVAGNADKQVLVPLSLLAGSTAIQAITAASLEKRLPGLEFDPSHLGIFGRRCRADQVLSAGDRVEVYQPLKADPKVVRREMAEIERAEKKSLAVKSKQGDQAG